jgi:hypothetical protein
MHQRSRLPWGVIPALAVLASPALAAERELDQDPPPSSASEIETPIERVFPEAPERPPLFPWVRQGLQTLPPFFADTQLEARFRTYYLRKDPTTDEKSEAWATGGSISYRSGWLEDLFAVEIEGFTSQPIVAPDDRGGTLLLEPVQDGYSVLGIANGKLRYKGIVLTGFRQYLDLPYFNRQDSRMTPNTFESITLAKPEGELRFSTGYTWKIKLRNSDEFQSMTKAIGLDEDRGLAHAGAVWDPDETFHLGAIVGVMPDVAAGIYGELGIGGDLGEKWEARFDAQFTVRWDIGKDLSGELFDDTWNLGIRASASHAGAVFRLGLSVTGPDASIESQWGTNPSYVDLMQRTFTRADEKALLASFSYDFSGLGVDGLSLIVNFVTILDVELGVREDDREIDVTVDYRVKKGLFESFWLRLRGSWLTEESTGHGGSDVRVILRYDFPVI